MLSILYILALSAYFLSMLLPVLTKIAICEDFVPDDTINRVSTLIVSNFLKLREESANVYVLTDTDSRNSFDENILISKFKKPLSVLTPKFNDKVTVRADQLLLVVGCKVDATDLLSAAKHSRLATVDVSLIILLSNRCTEHGIKPQDRALDLLKQSRTLLNAARAFAVFANGSAIHIFWLFAWEDPSPGSHITVDSVNLADNLPITVPKERQNFDGKILRVAVAHQPPYVIEGEIWRGVEVEVVRAIAQKYNFELQFLKSPDGEPPRMIYTETGKTAGLMGLLDRLEADLAFGGMQCDPARASVVDILTPGTVDTIKWGIPSPPVANNWNSASIALSSNTWILVVVVLALSSLTFALFFTARITYLQSLYILFLQIISVHLDQGFLLKNNHGFFRVLLALLLLYCLIITNAYRSALATLLTAAAKISWYETIEQVVADGYPIYIIPSGLSGYNEAAKTQQVWREILKPEGHIFTDNIADSLANVSLYRKTAMLTIEHPSRFTILGKLTRIDNTPMIILLKKRYQAFYVSTFTAPAFPSYHLFNSFVHQLQAGGLIDLWLTDALFAAELRGISNRYKHNVESTGPESLSLNHLKLAFLVYFAVLLASFFAFLIELLYNRSVVLNI